MGNSEVGHLNLGAGAIVKQDLARIDDAVEDGRWPTTRCCRPRWRRAARAPDRARLRRRRALARPAPQGADRDRRRRGGVDDLVLHAFTDGRDTPPHQAGEFLANVEAWMARPAPGASAPSSAATSRWTATSAGTARSAPTTCSCTAVASTTPSPAPAAQAAYERDETDEFITPTTVGEEARIRPGDAVIAFNFRPDRMREISARARPGLHRGRPRRRRAVSVRDDGGVRGGLDVPGRVPAQRPSCTIARSSPTRDWPAARRRDGEVPARDVLLQRR